MSCKPAWGLDQPSGTVQWLMAGLYRWETWREWIAEVQTVGASGMIVRTVSVKVQEKRGKIRKTGDDVENLNIRSWAPFLKLLAHSWLDIGNDTCLLGWYFEAVESREHKLYCMRWWLERRGGWEGFLFIGSLQLREQTALRRKYR